MRIPAVDLRAQLSAHHDELYAAIHRVVDSCGFILGPEVEGFERDFARAMGAAGAVGVGSGTAALELALRAVGVRSGDEVITAAFTFAATAEAIVHCGARPVFCDIEPGTLTIDPSLVDALVTPRTRALLPVHLYGHPADLDALSELCRRRGLWLIEDAAQAHGARWRGRPCGSWGDLACFSFYPGKNLGAFGDAGAVTGNDPELLARVRRLRNHGSRDKYHHEEVGFCERLDALQAAILSAKLPHLSAWNEARRRHARRYSELLADLPLTLPWNHLDAYAVVHLYVIRTPHRDELVRALQEHEIDAAVHYPRGLHRQPAFIELGLGDVVLPETDRAANEVLSLPMYPELTDDQIQEVAGVVRNVLLERRTR